MMKFMIDPTTNVNFLHISVDDLEFKKGGKELAKFYKFSRDHQMAMHLIANNAFHIRIFSMDFVKIKYPDNKMNPNFGERFSKSSPTLQILFR